MELLALVVAVCLIAAGAALIRSGIRGRAIYSVTVFIRILGGVVMILIGLSALLG